MCFGLFHLWRRMKCFVSNVYFLLFGSCICGCENNKTDYKEHSVMFWYFTESYLLTPHNYTKSLFNTCKNHIRSYSSWTIQYHFSETNYNQERGIVVLWCLNGLSLFPTFDQLWKTPLPLPLLKPNTYSYKMLLN